MIWLTWRQHRGEAIGVAVVLSLIGLLALATGLPMRRAFENDGVAECQQGNAEAVACAGIIETFRDGFSGIPLLTAGQLNFLPLVAGILIGAPLLAREYEHGTWQLAWTQSVTRTRWLTTKLALVLTAAVVATVTLSAILAWWLRPLDPPTFNPENFNMAAPVLTGCVLLAVTVGILAGTVIRRNVPAMAATLAVFLPIRLFVEFVLRPRYKTPVTVIDPAPGSRDLVQRLDDGKNWVLDTFLVGPSGHRLSDAEEFELFGGGVIEREVEAELGIKQAITYHPESRFWDFQLIETAIFGGLALLLAAIVVWRVRRNG